MWRGGGGATLYKLYNLKHKNKYIKEHNDYVISIYQKLPFLKKR